MTTRKIDKNFDWTFGKSKAQYLTGSDEIAQNVVTRLKSFKFDWYLDSQANIDWLTILGSKSNRQIIVNEISRVTAETLGVKNIIEVSIIEVTNRDAKIQLKYIDIYDNEFSQELDIL